MRSPIAGRSGSFAMHSGWPILRIKRCLMELLDLWDEIGELREHAERLQRDAVTAGNVLAALAIGQLIEKIVGLDWDIRVAEVRAFDERDAARQQALVAAERDRFSLALAELREALGCA